MRFQPFMEKLDELLAAGEIGEVTNIQALLSFIKVSDPSRRWLNLRLGGGSLLDLGVYPLTLIHHVLGEPERFEAVATLADTGVDLETAVVSRHVGGATATAVSSFVSDGANEAIVSGTQGRIRIHRTFHQSRLLSLERRDELIANIDAGYEGHGFKFEVAETERCIREGLTESPLRPHADTLAVLEWIDAIRARIGVEFPNT